jgi:hypothetical protein
MTNTNITVQCYTNQGQYRIFNIDATDHASTYAELTDLVTGNSLGDSLQGQVIVKAMGIVENFCISPGGIVFIDAQNNVLGTVQPSNPETQQPEWQSVYIPVALNYSVKALTSASVA